MAGIEKEGIPDHRFQFNRGTEKELSFGLNWYETLFISIEKCTSVSV